MEGADALWLMRATGNLMLALDTSTRTVSLGLYDGHQVLYELIWSGGDYHTVELAPAVADAFRKTGLEIAALGALAVALGPGSFTGLRVGLALAKGLALARKLPLIGVPTLDYLAAAQPGPGRQAAPDRAGTQAGPYDTLAAPRLAAVLRAGRGRLAVGWYHWADAGVDLQGGWQPMAPVEVLTLPDFARKITQADRVCGELSEDDRQNLSRLAPATQLASPAAGLRRPGYLAELAWKRWKAGQVDSPAGLSPIYLHYNDPIPA